MKIKFRLIIFVVSVFYVGTTFGQSEFVALTSSQLLKGLTDADYLSTSLTEDGFKLVKKSKPVKSKSGKAKPGSIYEYWQYKSMIFIDLAFNNESENYIIVRVNKEHPDVADRLIQTFPHKGSRDYNDHADHIKISHINKKTAYTLKYSKNDIYTSADIWFEDPFYFFQYTIWK